MAEIKAATPHGQLIEELMDSRRPAGEHEHAACQEIVTLRKENEKLQTALKKIAMWEFDLMRDSGQPPKGGGMDLAEKIALALSEHHFFVTPMSTQHADWREQIAAVATVIATVLGEEKWGEIKRPAA